MSDQYELSAKLRADVGKGASRRLRRLSDLVPGVIYGAKEATAVTFAHKDLQKALENEAFYSHIITINMEGEQDQAILKDIQRHPAKPRIMHADFMRVRSDQSIRVHVPLHFINQDICVGVKESGGSISRLVVEAEIICLPADLPEFIEVDMAEVEIGHSVHLSDLELPSGTSLTALLQEDNDLSVASVHIMRGIIEEEEVEEEVLLDEDGMPVQTDQDAADADADGDAEQE